MKKLIIFAVITLSYTLSCTKTEIKPVQNKNLALDYYKKGRKLFLKFTKDNAKKAIYYYKKAIKIKPDYTLAIAAKSEALSYLAFQIEKRGENAEEIFDEALKMAQKSLKINSNLSETHRALAWYFFSRGLYRFAFKNAQKALKIKPQDPESSFILWASINSNNLTSPYLKKAVKSDYIIALLNAGSLARRKKKYQKAIKYFREVIKLVPNHAHAFVNIGNVYLKLNETDKALDYYKKALKLQKWDCYIYFNYAAAYVVKKKYKTAEFYYKKAVKLNKNFLQAHLMLMRLYKKVFKNKKLYKYHKKIVRKIKQNRYTVFIKRLNQARNL